MGEEKQKDWRHGPWGCIAILAVMTVCMAGLWGLGQMPDHYHPYLDRLFLVLMTFAGTMQLVGAFDPKHRAQRLTKLIIGTVLLLMVIFFVFEQAGDEVRTLAELAALKE